ncbi:MAG TPA: uroporphyrinogen decarboxylase family protein, partial [Atribacteraceae bacterium]|nr:uroporphyrinogen decarboxylase family protein [Atribacteraceae bacterium]
ENVQALLDLCVQTGLRFARAQVDAGADLIGVGDAAVSMISPRIYEELILPYEQNLIQGIHDMGCRVKLHICGNTTTLLPLMARTGADIIDLDWMVDLALARRLCGDSIILCGNVDPVSVVLQGTPEDVRRKSIECFQQAGMPFILSAGCEIPAATPEENLRALCESVREMT